MRITTLTTKQMARIDRAIDGKLMAAVARAFDTEFDKLYDLDVQIADEAVGYTVMLTGLRSEEVVAWSEQHPVDNWRWLDENAREAVVQVARDCKR